MTEAEAMWALKTGQPVRYRLPTISGEEVEHRYKRITKIIYQYIRGKVVASAVIETAGTNTTVQCLIKDLYIGGREKEDGRTTDR